MLPDLTRRQALAATLLLPVFLRRQAFAAGDDLTGDDLIGVQEGDIGGRLGVAILDTASGAQRLHRAHERFPMCSTFKLLAAAAVLARVDQGLDRLDRQVPYTDADLLEYAPVTRERVGEGSMSLDDLCDAAVTLSDNTAANLLLSTLGGPAGLTAYARSLGDRFTRLDRMELSLNEATPGDPRDTTTPAAMLADLKMLLVGSALSNAGRRRLIDWMVGNKVGDHRFRAGVPRDIRIGDKTGTGGHGSTNDVGIAWPPGRAPVLIVAYLTECDRDLAAREAVLARIARLALGSG